MPRHRPHHPQSHLLFLFLFLLPLTQAQQSCPKVLNPPTSRIIGGIPATPPTRSFIAALFYPNDTFACTASLLSPQWLLTAAHCQVTTTWRVRIAGTRATDGIIVPIHSVFIHEAYRRGVIDAPGDIALIYLSHPVPTTASFIRVNTNASIPIPGSFARTAGYGWKQTNPEQQNLDAFQVDAPVNSPIKCRDIYSATLDIRASYFICVGYGKNGCEANSCNGDSGGPLFQYDPAGNPVQIGIVAFGMKCGEQGVPSVYVKLSAFVDWLASHDADFQTSSSVTSVFSSGSQEAASDDVATTLQTQQESDSGSVLISRVWFIVICVIAGIATIALIFVSLAYVSGSRRARRANINANAYANGRTYDRDSLQLAISILQGLAESRDRDRPPDSTQFSEASGVPPPTAGDIIIDEVTPRGRHAVNRLHPDPIHPKR